MARNVTIFSTIALTVLALSACDGGNAKSTLAPSEKETSSSILVSTNNPYSNPTYPIVDGKKKPTYMADPYVVRDDDGTFYLYCTQTDVYTPTLAFTRGPIFSSDDMVNWTYRGNVFDSYTPNWGTSGAGVWAPTVIKVGDVWNFYYALSTGGDENPGIGVATSPIPYGPWTHYGKLFNSKEIGVTNSIDPHVFYDDGRLYMAFGSFGGYITLVELSADGLSLSGGLEEQKQEKVSLAGYGINDLNNYEATFILKKDGYYYMFLSTGSCCSGAQSTYKAVVARSQSLKGPYLDSQGRDMFAPNRGDPVVVPSLRGAMGTGHCAVMQDDAGEYWMIYHGYDTQGADSSLRVTYLDRLIFDEETGMPHVKGNQASNHETLPGPYIASKETGHE